MEITMLLWLIPLAVVLDLAVRYPRLPHPVSGLGWLLHHAEGLFRPLSGRLQGQGSSVWSNGEFRSGLLAIFCSAFLAGLLVWLLGLLPFLGGWILLFLCYTGLALGHLLREGRRALEALEKGHIEYGRSLVSQLVSRDLSHADTKDIYRALAETLAENFNDAFVTPLFWLTLCGPAGLWFYKTISTGDSMWGYHTERWEYFGKAAARTDDVLAYIPARLSALLLRLSACGMGGAARTDLWPGWGRIRSQARSMESPNAGWPMAVAAWLHGAAMGGATIYHGEVVNKPHLGPDGTEEDAMLWDVPKIKHLMFHLFLSGLTATCLVLALLIVALWV